MEGAELAEFVSGGISRHDGVLLLDLACELTNEGNVSSGPWPYMMVCDSKCPTVEPAPTASR